MLGSDIRTLFESQIDDSLDDVYTYVLMNTAKGLLEGERDWEILKKVDQSQSWLTSDTFLTPKTLPADFFMPREIFVSGDTQPYLAIPFDQREQYQSYFRRYYIDHANKQFFMCGVTGSNVTIKFFYNYATPDLTANTSPVWPAIYHPLIAFYMAAVYQGAADADAISARMSGENRGLFEELRRNMRRWDARLKLQSLNGQAMMPEINARIRADVVDLDYDAK